MKLQDKVQCVDIVPGFPSIVFNFESVPLDQVMQFPIDHSAIQNLLYDPFFFSINDFWEQGVLGDTSKFQPLRQNISASRLRTHSISMTLCTFPHTEDNSTIHTWTHLRVNLRLLARSRSPRYSETPQDTSRYSEVLCIYHCCIVDSLVCPPLWLYFLICSICDFIYNSGLILAEALSYSFRTSC